MDDAGARQLSLVAHETHLTPLRAINAKKDKVANASSKALASLLMASSRELAWSSLRELTASQINAGKKT